MLRTTGHAAVPQQWEMLERLAFMTVLVISRMIELSLLDSTASRIGSKSTVSAMFMRAQLLQRRPDSVDVNIDQKIPARKL